MFSSTPSGPPAKRDILPVLGGGGGVPLITPLKEKTHFFPLGGGALHVEVTQGGPFRTKSIPKQYTES